VLYPADGVSATRLVEEAVRVGGVVYLRVSRPKTKVIYAGDELFPIGGSKVHGAGDKDAATIIAGGVTLYEALEAQKRLAADGTRVRVIDLYSVKPIDQATLQRAADETRAFITVEDHAAWGGLGEAVAAAVRVPKLEILAVRELPRSAKPAELLAMHGLDAASIVQAVKKVLR
jgi:transketolase